MRAWRIHRLASLAEQPAPLQLGTLPDPEPGPRDILIRVNVCGVCHTELDEIEGRTPPPRLPVVPGHQAVGVVAACGAEARRYAVGDRVGVGWIASACGACSACVSGRENLCPDFSATGRDVDGGYAESMTAHEDFAVPIPQNLDDATAATLLCAGAIGWRSLKLARLGRGERLGLTGFGASGAWVLQFARHCYPTSEIYVFARSAAERDFAREVGAVWAGDTETAPPEPLDAVIDTTPAWRPLVAALRSLAPGGRLVVNAIRKETADRDAWLSLDYARDLWMEKTLVSVANVTRADIWEALDLADAGNLRAPVQTYGFSEANAALQDIRGRRIRGGKVLRVSGEG